MLHFFDNPFTAENEGFDPACDILIGPALPPGMANERLKKALDEMYTGNSLSEEDLTALDKRAEQVWEDWESLKALW